ncbi:outer membrane protein assembly factor BamD [Reichenbachiella agarivorans]|uniref:Outer membrane protein assembly factor BamD n=1 Tax=Reichenbachiella agarivorans TaxID=2979464 RepID=A0ABY6CJD5_9BACT|nr:outer membrane protein assembly factor BamD [Reichenbachiella agarivorans]UXP30637.1 outer membrane protein assembly factor BamD [Reichenbachiella agarivorans]
MRKVRFFRVFVIVLSVVLATSCSEFRKLQKSTDWQAKYQAALAYYNVGEYYKASVLLDQVLPVIKGTVDGEKASYYRAYAYYHQKQYILSASYFKDFSRVYSRSEWAIESSYMEAYSLYLQSPDYNLDQSSTYKAIDAFQIFLNRNPYTDYTQKANDMINEMQVKLETKAFENAKHYHKLERWEAARVAFETFENEFPDSKLNEKVAFLAIDAEFSYAEQSIRAKQKERYEKTIELYQVFLDKYPNSTMLRDAEKYYIDSVNQIDKLSNRS